MNTPAPPTPRPINIADRNPHTDIIISAPPIYYYTNSHTPRTPPPNNETHNGTLIINSTPYATGLSSSSTDTFTTTITAMQHHWSTLTDWEIMIAGIENFNRGRKNFGTLIYQSAIIQYLSAQTLLNTETLEENNRPTSMLWLQKLKEPSMPVIIRYLINTRENQATRNILDATITEAKRVRDNILKQGLHHRTPSILRQQGYPLIVESHWPDALNDTLVFAAHDLKQFVLTYTPE